MSTSRPDTRRWWVVALALGVGVPFVARAPKPGRDDPTVPATLDEAIAAVQLSGLSGWEQVDYATRLVNRRFLHYSIWHTWESPRLAYRHRRGHSNQYNLALATLLRSVGFDVTVVHAARVRGEGNPWWHVGHTWLRVSYDGVSRDVCASAASNTAGHVNFVPASQVRPANPWSPLVMAVALLLFTVPAVWRSWLTGRPVPRWLYRPFGTPVGAASK